AAGPSSRNALLTHAPRLPRPKPVDKTNPTASLPPMGTLSSARKPWPHRGGRKANGSSIMIRGLDIPRGRLATLWPLQRTNQARAFDADAEAGSHVAQNEGQEEEVEGLEHAARPVADPDSGAPRGFDRRRSDTDETIGRPTVTEPMSKPMEPHWRTRGPAGASNDGRRVLAGVLRWPVPRDPAEESNA
uniref:hypothetical protein n=10 Tax=Pseudomonas aeruginosa TaxID=287 RepID=UPI001A9F4656